MRIVRRLSKETARNNFTKTRMVRAVSQVGKSGKGNAVELLPVGCGFGLSARRASVSVTVGRQLGVRADPLARGAGVEEPRAPDRLTVQLAFDVRRQLEVIAVAADRTRDDRPVAVDVQGKTDETGGTQAMTVLARDRAFQHLQTESHQTCVVVACT